MDLEEFLRQTQAEVRSQMSSDAKNYSEWVFAEVVMQHMADIGMTFDPELCHYAAKVGNANVRLTGYAISDETDQLDLFVSLYAGVDEVTSIPDSETKNAADQCLRFLAKVVDGKLASTMDQSHEAYPFVLTIHEYYPKIDQIRIYVLTDRQAKAKNFASREVGSKTIKLEVMDIERLYRHWAEGKPRDELEVNFEDVSGGPLPCVFVPGEANAYDYALTVIPGEALRFLYEKYGARLLEANVRSFLSVTGKVNRGIRDTLKDCPEMFLAYNNGIVLIADEIRMGNSASGGHGIKWMRGIQIVNGGQTTASIYFCKKKNAELDLSRVRVPAKIIIIHSQDSTAEEELVSAISRFANSQNAVKQADLSANKPFHVAIEKHSAVTFCPDGTGRWFYERAAGSYNVMLAKEGTTPSKLKQLRESIPSTRKITKTDLAKFHNAWDQKPNIVSLGSQKNFAELMKGLDAGEGTTTALPTVIDYKQLVAKAIIFKTASKLVRPMFPAFQGNVCTYLVSIMSDRLGNRLDLDRVWQRQDLSPELKALMQMWAHEVNRTLHHSAAGKMISEWAKRPECWGHVQSGTYNVGDTSIPELRQ